ncbi:MAG TPA: 4'-phosphopantetheinyl transferase superfamily protein [candidate division Zixibacteria bacterium]|nr:4'-phosphopantetheinyl transferase superfamily protein [candidate division Zixibacteria bacterium]
MVVNVSDFWVSPMFPMKLKDNDVHIWRSKLEQPDLCVPEFASVLSVKERMRAAGYLFEEHRKRFIVGRAVLRTILAYYLNTEPGKLQFCYGPRGKPYLAERSCEASVQFNMAHSNELALYAFTVKRRIGVDLEYIHKIPDVEKIVARIFPKGENFETLPNSQKLNAFFNCWTRTEACAKAVGTGLAQSFDGFDASLTREEPACPSSWFITSFAPAPDYTASLVVEGHNCALHYFEFML